ncbi:FtsX-like permease family protein [Micromonospora sp. NPDC051296]|uniref:FtsX-like permease family protein n=1 Tax=Micromonospora sp. NPDC051296 TaxID=3155046 RepID=UPI00341775A3
MLGFIWRQLRGRAGRSVALMLGALVATTSFIVLTGSTTASRLEVIGVVERNSPAAYDILVRPQGSRTAQEVERGLVQPNYLSGLFGGITLAQYRQVAGVAGVQVAAPIAMLGYSIRGVALDVDVSAAVDPDAERQVIRLDPTFTAERGLSRATARPHHVYLTRNEVVHPESAPEPGSAPVRHSNGKDYPAGRCAGGFGAVPLEILPDGRTEAICVPPEVDAGYGTTRADVEEGNFLAVRLLPDGRFEQSFFMHGEQGPEPERIVEDRLVVRISWYVPFLLAAVDPPAEERLVGLSGAVVAGRELRTDDLPHDVPNWQNREFPVLVTNRPYVDGSVAVSLSRLHPERVAGLSAAALARALAATDRTPAGSLRLDVNTAHRTQLAAEVQDGRGGALWPLVQAGQLSYDLLPDGGLRPRTVKPDPGAWALEKEASIPVPWLSADVSFRPLHQLKLPNDPFTLYPGWRAVGVFDPERLTQFADLSRVPLETYEAPAAEGADEPSRAALGGQPLLPSGNPAGYFSTPPFLLTNLASLPKLLKHETGPQRDAPISAIRVRVEDVDGYSELSAEQVRLVAQRIAEATGLDVDITLGSSPAPQTVELPAGSFGRPELRLTENWSALGVASVIVQAVDRKSVLLFLLVLVVCALFLGNAVAAAVRDRRSELAVLACLGWPARRISLLILGEVAVLGLVAGLLSLALAIPTAAALGIDVGWRAVLAIPVALLLALVAGLVPALRANRAHPAAALRPAVAEARRAGRPHTVLRLALINLARTPGRTLLGAAALAIGVAALTLVGAVTYAFQGAVVGSLLGDAISLSVRSPDLVAAVATVLLGTAAVADVLYLGIRDRAAELATLHAVGWTDRTLSRLVGYEGLALGVLGATTGALLGLLGTVALIGSLPGGLLLVALATAAAGIVVSCLAALVPAVLLRRLPLARLLAEE